ncbi:Cys/Met metabolism pyridoxal-phosphate-dependent protein [Pseudomonas syringae]|uniref:Cys/Met metabolism pyridoxal-phosphate-dependent protein n=2 Tax=Pseudomonas syringae TaxID=317 RepID=A0A1C7YY36_PSESX|nr:Cys/Met metabolism pyridoxal-phosphate-dependent protein [Pseudomonas syringae]
MPEFTALNMPVHRASTLTYASARDFLNRFERMMDGFSYGLYGTPTGRALEQQIAQIEGGGYCMLLPSGLAAVTHPMLCLLKHGDHVLLADCVYGPTRDLCTSVLAQYGITHTFFPSDASTIEPWLNDATKLVVLESPGSYTMEIQDIAVIAAQAHKGGALVLMDNAWGFGQINCFEHGVDIVCTALSKYASGHSDVCMGSCTVKERSLFEKLKMSFIALGTGVAADDAYLVMRGLQTLTVRLAEHEKRGLAVAKWLDGHPAVSRVFFPALDTDPQHKRFKRYFYGANGVISLILHEEDLSKIEQFIDSLEHFRIGASWGGTHSLIALTDISKSRTSVRWKGLSWILRLHVGLEPIEALMHDLDRAFSTLTPE